MAYGQVLGYWGHLSVIPALVDLYERYYFSQDSIYVVQTLSQLLEDLPGDIQDFPEGGEATEFREYCGRVRMQYQKLSDRLGTHDAVVFRGEVISIQHICKKMIDDLEVRHGFHEEMRHKFEAVTGIDCSSFYVNGSLQPLTVAAVIEQFLESPDAAKYQRGVRYFFGHRVPD